jgi:RHS repeat-associated protein
LDDFQLLHMNGRILDSLSGRVLSADPFIPNPYSTQDYNRYSYVNNNPLRYTDPSGFACEIRTVPIFAFRPEIITQTDETGKSVAIRRWKLVRVGSRSKFYGCDSPADVPQGKRACYAPFNGGSSFVGAYLARVGNLAAGLLDSISGSVEFGLQVKGKVNVGPFFNGTATFGMANGSLGTSGAGNVDLNVRVPSPGSAIYGEASAGAGNMKFGAARDSVVDGISVRRGPYEDYQDGFFFKPTAKLAEPSWGKVGGHLQVGVGASLEVDFLKAGNAVSCAFQ